MKECKAKGMIGDACRTQCNCIKLEDMKAGENILPEFLKATCPENVYEEAVGIMQSRSLRSNPKTTKSV